ncbi:MAG: hypothetical protein NUV86_01220, partial [Candidatus Scalindua sp.]|nr:hypothetical protein [Candidatus Scalindua sp.]
MSDKSINLLLGVLSTKELPGAGRLKTTNYSIGEHHNNDSFHARLMNSMEKTQTYDEQNSTDIQSESANIKGTDDINQIRELLSLGIKVNQTAKTDGDQTQLNPEVNQNINENEFTNAIINKVSNQKISTAQIMANTLLETPHLNNQELKSLGGANLNIAQKQTGDLIPEPVAPLSDKLSTTQVTTNITQQIPGDIEQEQLQTSLSDKLNTALSNTKISDQKILDIINNPGLSETAKESEVGGSMLQQSKLSASHATAPSENILSEIQNKDNIKGTQNPVPAIEKARSEIINLNTSSHTDESGNNKINEMFKEQHQNKPLSSTANKNLQTQNLAQAQIESEETHKTFEASANTTESKPTKSVDNITLASNSNINTIIESEETHKTFETRTNTTESKPTKSVDNITLTSNSNVNTVIEGEETHKTFETSANTTESKPTKLVDNITLANNSNVNTVIGGEETHKTFKASANTTELKPTKLVDNTTLTSNSNVNTVIESEETHKTFETSANTTESKLTKLVDNITLANNSNVNTV